MLHLQEEPSLSDLLKELIQEVKTLVKQEIDLVKAEMSQKISRAGKDLILVAAGASLAYAGLFILLAAAVLMVAQFLPGWLAALLVGLIVVAVGYGFIQKGLTDIKQMNPVPHESINALKENKSWVTQPTR